MNRLAIGNINDAHGVSLPSPLRFGRGENASVKLSTIAEVLRAYSEGRVNQDVAMSATGVYNDRDFRRAAGWWIPSIASQAQANRLRGSGVAFYRPTAPQKNI